MATASPGGASCTTDTAACTIFGLTNRTQYSVSVVAKNSIGSSPASDPVQVTPREPDVTPPSLADFSVTPDAVNVYFGSATVIVSAHVVDDNSGAQAPYISLSSESTNQSAGFGQMTLISGDQFDGTYRAQITLPQGAAGGVWDANLYPLSDLAGNSTSHFTVKQFTVSNRPPLPDAPVGVVATLVGNSATSTSVSISWTPPTDTGGVPLVGYSVTGDPDGTCSTTSATSCVIDDLRKNTSYTFTVTARNETGDGPASSSSVPVTTGRTAPGAPSMGSAVAGASSATVTWTPPTDNGGTPITNYVVTPYLNGAVAQSPTFVGNLTSAVVAGLSKGASYTFTVLARNTTGDSSPSDASNSVTIATTVPGAPTGVAAEASTVGQSATVTWSAPADTGGSPITGYVVTPYLDGTSARTPTTVGPVTRATIAALAKGRSYTFTVAAVTSVGTSSESDATSEVTIPATSPGAPSIKNATVSSVSPIATVTWLPPADDGGAPITNYVVTPYLNGTVAQPSTFVGDVTSAVVAGLAKGASYTFTVLARNTIGDSSPSSASNSVTIATTTPGAPTIGSADASGAGSVTITWSAPADTGGSTITGYVVTSYLDGATAQTPTAVNDATQASISGLAKGHSYTFKVAAINVVGTGEQSAASRPVVIASTAPRAPGNVAARAVAQGAVVSWSVPADDGGTPITSYVITPHLNGATALTSTTVGDVATATITGLTKGRSYSFTVVARNAVGDSTESASSNSVTIAATVPGAPTGVNAVAGDQSATVTWTAPTDTGGGQISGYTLTTHLVGTANSSVVVLGSLTSYVVTGLTKGASYAFRVSASNSLGDGEQSADSDPVAIPTTHASAPVQVEATAGDRSASVQWLRPEDDGGFAALDYTVTSSPSGKTCTVTSDATVPFCTVTGLTNGTAYTFTVVALNANGPSSSSTASDAVIPRAGTTMVITAAPTTTVHGVAAKIVGKVTSDGAPVSGLSVKLQYRHQGSKSAFSTFATTAKSTSSGAVTFSTFKPAYTVEVQLTVATGGAYLASASAPKFVSVTRTVSIASNHASVNKGASFVLSGTVSPNSKGKKAVLKRKSGSTWKTVTSVTLGSTSKYSFTVKSTAKGTFSYRVSVAADTNFGASLSAAKAVKVT